jgi:rhodanese-related sulfurtransferase
MRVDLGRYVEVGVEELHADTDPDKVVLDVREPAETAQGTVAGARCVPLGRLATVLDELDDDANVYVVCRSGSRSAFAAEALTAAGKSDAKNVAGGLNAWVGAGYPLVR